MQNLSNKIGFDLHENEPVGETHFHIARTKTRSDTEAKDTSEMAYCIDL